MCKDLKGAVCRILTLLKHKNTIIFLQIFKKHAKLTYLFIWKTMLQSVILLWKCAFWPGMSVFVMVCETLPLPVYPIVFRHPGLPVGGKHSVFHFIHRHVRSFLLVSLIWQPVCASSLRRRGWWKKTSPIFWIWSARQPLGVNPTYSTFNIYIYIYAFSRRFYPKRLTLHSSYSFTFDQLLLSLGIEPMILALLAPCSTIWATGKYREELDAQFIIIIILLLLLVVVVKLHKND